MILANTRTACAAGLFSLLLAASLLVVSPAMARDGVTDCSIAEVDTKTGPVWRHNLTVQIPDGGHCRIYIADDKDSKSWKYCSLRRAHENPVSETCDDPVDVKTFDVWTAKAVCGTQNFIATCRREKPLVPTPR